MAHYDSLAAEVRGLRLRQVAGVGAGKGNAPFGHDAENARTVGKYAFRRHLTGAPQLSQKIDQARAADSARRHIADGRKAPAAAVRGEAFDGPLTAGHAVGDQPAFESGAGGAGCRHHAAAMRHDNFGIRADIDQHAGFGRRIHAGGEQVRRGVRAHVASNQGPP